MSMDFNVTSGKVGNRACGPSRAFAAPTVYPKSAETVYEKNADGSLKDPPQYRIVFTMSDGQVLSTGLMDASVAKGAKGDKGDQGPKGDTGDQGPKGDKGDTGPKGDKGDQGIQGVQGPTGQAGQTGRDGQQGATGPRGDKGDKGDDGAPGAAIITARLGGSDPNQNGGPFIRSTLHTGVNQAALSGDLLIDTDSGKVYQLSFDTKPVWTYQMDIMGPQGPQGIKGDQGVKGDQGAQGTPGSIVIISELPTYWLAGFGPNTYMAKPLYRTATGANNGGASNPSPLPQTGDILLVPSTGDIYVCTGSVDGDNSTLWNGPVANVKGPKGDVGPRGATGETSTVAMHYGADGVMTVYYEASYDGGAHIVTDMTWAKGIVFKNPPFAVFRSYIKDNTDWLGPSFDPMSVTADDNQNNGRSRVYNLTEKGFTYQHIGLWPGSGRERLQYTVMGPVDWDAMGKANLPNAAKVALDSVGQQAAIVVALGKSYGPKMQAYVAALENIANGSDTTSTALPIAPSDPTT